MDSKFVPEVVVMVLNKVAGMVPTVDLVAKLPKVPANIELKFVPLVVIVTNIAAGMVAEVLLAA